MKTKSLWLELTNCSHVLQQPEAVGEWFELVPLNINPDATSNPELYVHQWWTSLGKVILIKTTRYQEGQRVGQRKYRTSSNKWICHLQSKFKEALPQFPFPDLSHSLCPLLSMIEKWSINVKLPNFMAYTWMRNYAASSCWPLSPSKLPQRSFWHRTFSFVDYQLVGRLLQDHKTFRVLFNNSVIIWIW